MTRLSADEVKTAIYLRVSLDATGEGLAVERQREDCERIARERGWTIVETYTDNSISAYAKTKKRPAYDRMVADYAAGRFTALVCWDLDRLTRQPRQLEDWIDAAEERGLRLVTANGEADLATDGGRMYARIKAAVARAEVERKGKRQSRAQLQRAEKGRPPRGIRATGYELDGEVIAAEAEVVRAVFAAFAQGASLRGLAAALSGEDPADVPKTVTELPTRSGRPWNPSSVRGILINPRYAGWSMLAGEIVRDSAGSPVQGNWEPIVSDELWLETQARLEDPARKTNRVGTARKHLGSGLFLCGICEKPVRSHNTRYRCAGHIMRSRDQIDRFVLRTIQLRLDRPDSINLLATDNSEVVKALKAEIETHRGRIKRAKADYQAEMIDGSFYKEIKDAAEIEIAKLDSQRIALADNPALDRLLRAPYPGLAFLDADLATQRQAIGGIAQVRLYPHPRGRKNFDRETVDIDFPSDNH